MSDDDNIRNLGPLAALAGVWEGDAGIDISPSAERGIMETPFRERVVFEPMGCVDNHEQKLWALRYATKAYRLGEADAFHEEVGYWLWDPCPGEAKGQIMRAFVVPRGITILAGGDADANAQQFSLAADVGSETYGIASNRFLDTQFKTIRFELEVNLEGDGVFEYKEDTQLQMKGHEGTFHHRDSNRLTRAS
jgi:hypothetical protein